MRRQLDAALAAQQAGRYAEAIALYEAVVAREPGNFDALHMLGVARYQRGEFDPALELLTAALAISPSHLAVRHNLRLVRSALELRAVEGAICRETLPRLGKRCVAPPRPDDRRRWHDTSLDLVVSKVDPRSDDREIDRLLRWLGSTSPSAWLYPGAPDPGVASLSFRTIDPDTGAVPQHRTTVFYGAEISPATWYPRSIAADIALFCDSDDARILVDRIPELANEGRTPLRLLFASSALAQRIALPGCIVESSNIE